MSCTSPATDRALYSTLGGDPDLAELVELFVAEMPGRVAQLRQEYEQNKWDQLARTAHQLKGAAGSYGFHQITPYAGRLEMAVRNGRTPQEIGQHLDELAILCRCVRAGVCPS